MLVLCVVTRSTYCSIVTQYKTWMFYTAWGVEGTGKGLARRAWHVETCVRGRACVRAHTMLLKRTGFTLTLCGLRQFYSIITQRWHTNQLIVMSPTFWFPLVLLFHLVKQTGSTNPCRKKNWDTSMRPCLCFLCIAVCYRKAPASLWQTSGKKLCFLQKLLADICSMQSWFCWDWTREWVNKLVYVSSRRDAKWRRVVECFNSKKSLVTLLVCSFNVVNSIYGLYK